MVQFYKTYKNDKIATPLVTQLSWTNNLLILSGSKTEEERHFYIKLVIELFKKRISLKNTREGTTYEII